MTLAADLNALARQFDRYLRAENKSPKTIEAYTVAVRSFIDHTVALPARASDEHPTARPRTVAEIRPGHLDSWILALQSTPAGHRGKGRFLSEATVNQRYRGLQQFFRWLVAVEHEIDVDPFYGKKPPKVTEPEVPVLRLDQQRALLDTCGKGRQRPFADIRDEAIMRLMIDAGPRRSEVANLRTGDLDFHIDVAHVTRKGRRGAALPMGQKTANAIERYQRVRDRHPKADTTDAFWLAPKGAFTGRGIYQMIRRRGAMIGLPKLYPHQFRHTFSHEWLANGGSETDLMRINGWESRSMLSRYARSAAAQRAREAHRNLSPGDRL